MNFKFPCPHCGQRISAAPEDAGTTGGCPTCGQQFVVPAAPAPEPVMVSPTPVVMPEPVTKRGVAIVALLLSFFPVINLVAVGLAIYALIRSGRPGRQGEKTLAIVAVILSVLLLVPVNGGVAFLASKALVNFKKYAEPPDFKPTELLLTAPEKPAPAPPAPN